MNEPLSFSSDLSVSIATSTETIEATESALVHVAKLKKDRLASIAKTI